MNAYKTNAYKTNDTDHNVLMALHALLDDLKGSYVEKYAYFYAKDPNCSYVHKAKKAYIIKDKEILMQRVQELCEVLGLQVSIL